MLSRTLPKPFSKCPLKAKIPFNTFIARGENEQKSRRPNMCTSKSAVDSSSNDSSIQTTKKSRATTQSAAQSFIVEARLGLIREERELHKAEGTSKMRKVLVQKLAKHENAENRLVWQYLMQTPSG